MAAEKRLARLRDAGVTPTMQRLAILEYLEGTKSHPTANEVYVKVRKTCPTIARATVYNTLEALTKAGTILQLTVDPAAARYDADTEPHVHFRCRLCSMVYDIDAKQESCLGDMVKGHRVESVRTYAFGVCASCHEDVPAETARQNKPTARPRLKKLQASSHEPPPTPAPQNEPKARSVNASRATPRQKKSATSSVYVPPAIVAQENDLKGRSHKASDSTRGRRTHNAP